MIETILLWITWIAGVVVSLVALVPPVKENRKAYNALNSNFIKVMVVLLLIQGGGFVAKFMLLNVMGLTEPVIPQNLRIDMITSFGLLAVLLHFSLYATNLREHYGLPWVWYTFILVFFIQLGAEVPDTPVILSSAVVACSLSILFIYKAVKNRSGLMLGIGFYIIINAITALANQYFGKNILEEETFVVIGFLGGNVVFALATWDVFDRYILYDRQKEKSIKSTWIAKITQSGSDPTMTTLKASRASKQPAQIQRRVTCPACKASKIWLLPGDVIATRERSQKGIIVVSVPAGTTCDHPFSMYIGKTYEILGYEK